MNDRLEFLLDEHRRWSIRAGDSIGTAEGDMAIDRLREIEAEIRSLFLTHTESLRARSLQEVS